MKTVCLKVHTLPAGDLPVADLLSGVVTGSSKTELDEGREIVERVDLVVDAAVLGVGTLCPLGVRRKAGVVDCVVETLLRIPLQVVAEIVNHHL